MYFRLPVHMAGLLLGICLLIAPLLSYAQAPQGINYQAVARDGNALLANQTVTVVFTLIQSGGNVYEETHSVNTNAYGLFTAVIGTGIVQNGDFSTLDWSSGNMSLKVELDTGTGLLNMGTTALVSVPYSLYAEKVNLNLDDLQDVSASSPTNGQVLKWDGNQWVLAEDANTGTSIVAGTGINVDNDTIHNTAPDQVVTLSGNGATSVSGSYPDFTISSTDQVNDADADPANELQTLSLNGNDLTISDGNTLSLPQTTYQGGTGIAITGNTIANTAPDQVVSLSGSGASSVSGTYPSFTISSTDANTTYTAGVGLSLSGTTFTNTGDPDATDDLTIGTSAGGDLSGTFPNPEVVNLRGLPLAATAPSPGDVLSWNGTDWSPGAGAGVWSQNGNTAFYNTGPVGIGTNSPAAEMEIASNSSLSSPHILLHENGNDYARVNFDNNNGSNYWTVAAYVASNPKNDRFNIWNGATGDILSITGDGQMGLGVGISPKTTFHVGNGQRVLFGSDTLGNGDKLMWLPDLHAFRVGSVATGAASTYWNRDSIGLYSFASGLNTRAQGFGATAMGRDTEATNSYAFASGFFSNADGQYSTAMGFNTDALALGSTALGYSTDAEENYSFAAGYFAEAQGIYSVAIGNGVRAQSHSSMAIGRYNVGGGSASSWNTGDPIFEIGIGSSTNNRANAMTVRKNGNVGIGTTVPLDALHVNGRVRFQTVEYFEDGGTNEIAARGDIRPSADNTYDLGTASMRWDDVFATSGTVNTSDRRDKEAIEPLHYGLETVMRLKPVSFQWKSDPLQTRKLGLIAQDLLQTVPEVVKTHNANYHEETQELMVEELDRLGVYYADLIPVLVKGMQDQQSVIEAQQRRIEALEQAVLDLQPQKP